MNRFDKLPVRWRLAITSAGLTFVILLLFSVLVEVVTVSRVRSDFANDLRASAQRLADQMRVIRTLDSDQTQLSPTSRNAIPAAIAGGSVIRILDLQGQLVQNGAMPANAPDLGKPSYDVHQVQGYSVVSREIQEGGHPIALLEYGKPHAALDNTIGRVRLFLILGVLGGSMLALLAGLAVARRAMSPIARLTSAAKDIARTRDPGVHLPMPEADDEVADLARTLEQMLVALDSARGETQAMLERQREFVADASHELRTPLTSILTNLELLEADLSGEDREIAGAALRSSQRMRRLVADLLLLARADAGRQVPHEPVNLGSVVREAAAEVAPTALDHDLAVDADDSGLTVTGAPDELHRLAVNLIGNAVSHTPTGTSVNASVRHDGAAVTLTVEDNGPGVPPELRDRIFDRFVRGNGDAGVRSGSGLGLAIVKAVADSHGGSVHLESPAGGGARFVVTLPGARVERPAEEPVRA
jgi:two-component system, OmpR family, sensor kinase